MKKLVCCIALLLPMLCMVSPGHSQALPTATDIWAWRPPGFQLPRVEGSLNYAVSVSQRADLGYNGANGAVYFTTVSGDVAYLSGSLDHPFSMVYSGGYLGTTAAQPSAPFQSLALSQVFDSRFGNITVSDSFQYLPETPSAGFSGVPGLGDLGVAPVQVGPDTGQGILSNYATRVDNTSVASISRKITGSISFFGSGSFMLERFVGGSGNTGFDTNVTNGSGGLNHRIDALTGVGGDYTFSRYNYVGDSFSFISQGVNLQAQRQFSRSFSGQFSVGPQWTTSSQPLLSPSSLSFAADASVTYSNRELSSTVLYTRSTASGAGIALGVRTDAINGVARRRLSENWSGVLNAGYTRSRGLATLALAPLSTRAVLGGVELDRKIGRTLSAFMSYNAQRQTIEGSSFANTALAYSGLYQVFGVGLTYAPRSIHLGHQ